MNEPNAVAVARMFLETKFIWHDSPIQSNVEKVCTALLETDERARRLHEALRLRSLVPVYAPNLSTIFGQQCVLCGALSERGRESEPPHLPDCLAAPLSKETP